MDQWRNRRRGIHLHVGEGVVPGGGASGLGTGTVDVGRCSIRAGAEGNRRRVQSRNVWSIVDRSLLNQGSLRSGSGSLRAERNAGACGIGYFNGRVHHLPELGRPQDQQSKDRDNKREFDQRLTTVASHRYAGPPPSASAPGIGRPIRVSHRSHHLPLVHSASLGTATGEGLSRAA